MNQRFTLDIPSFQKLLEAAWVLQCQRDRELSAAWVFQCQRDRELSESHVSESQSGVTVLAVRSDKDELNAALPLTSPDSVLKPAFEPVVGPVLEPARAVAAADAQTVEEIVNPSVVDPAVVTPATVLSPLTIAPIYQRTGVAGALALAEPNRLRDPIPFRASDSSQEAVPRKNETAAARISRRVNLHLVWFGAKYRVGLRLVPFRDEYKGEEHALSMRTASVFKHASRVTTAYAAPVVVLAITLAFVFSMLGGHRPGLTAVNAALPVPKIVVDKSALDKTAADDSPKHDYVGQAKPPVTTGSERPRTDLHVLATAAPEPNVREANLPEPSHQRVTDAAASSLVSELSSYEMKTVRQQAEYGDAVAALTLGMAYEIGRYVPQSCADAAHWVAVAAKEGNSAAQYNLALRYVSGDGTPTNLHKARKWLEKAAGRGYQKAQLTLQASHL
jgi:Sel1 repeat